LGLDWKGGKLDRVLAGSLSLGGTHPDSFCTPGFKADRPDTRPGGGDGFHAAIFLSLWFCVRTRECYLIRVGIEWNTGIRQYAFLIGKRLLDPFLHSY